MRTFDRDDAGYLAWIDANQQGFVVNSHRKPKADYLWLHRATCKSISRTPPEGVRWTTSDFIKVCSEEPSELEEWARENAGGALSLCGKCRPGGQRSAAVTRGSGDRAFDRYPHGGRELLGRPRSGIGTCRLGYGLALQQMTGEMNCAYCGVSLVDTYRHWLLMSIDHVVLSGEARRVGIGPEFYEDSINLVLCCAGRNGFGNRYRCEIDPQETWTLDEFLTLRDAVFDDRFRRVATRREAEMAHFEARPWTLQGHR